MSDHSDWREASKAEPCATCGKTSWCSITGPEGAIEAVVCMRVESDNQRPNGGWLHRIRESNRMNYPSPPKVDKPQKAYIHARDAVAALEKQLGQRSATWTYLDSASAPIGLVCRWNGDDGKTIRPISKVANGWTIGAMPEPRQLYQLPSVIASPAVIVVEGEPAADAIRTMGYTATTSSGGSAAAAKTDWSPLAGKNVPLWGDNDDAGRKYLDLVIAELAKLNPRPNATVIRAVGLPEKGDAVDWIAAGGNKEQLAKLIVGAEPVVWPEQSPREQSAKFTLLTDAAEQYLDRLNSGQVGLISLGIPELDYALGGGVELGEVIVPAARPSHGKSAFALQASHSLNEQGIDTLLISEEMSKLALGKRTLQWASNIPLDRWDHSVDDLRRDLNEYKSARAKCIISDPCGTIEAVIEAIERAVSEHGVKAVCIDYAQLLRGRGKSKYEQVSYVSNTLRETATRLNLLMLVLCQLNREVEKRTRFIPTNADIRDSGTIEQDADVILLLAWPHKVDPKHPANQYQIFVSKNRNRAINQPLVVCRFDPTRQKISESTAREQSNYCPDFEDDLSFNPFGE